jgi:hypothetical protein
LRWLIESQQAGVTPHVCHDRQFDNGLIKMKRSKSTPLHPRYDRSHALLRELVSVRVDASDGASFSTLLTRVPCIGEAIAHEGKFYRILRVFHESVDDDGRAFAGYHAYIDAEYWPDEHIPQIRRPRPKRGTKFPF